jgi:hypothetical protein
LSVNAAVFDRIDASGVSGRKNFVGGIADRVKTRSAAERGGALLDSFFDGENG